MSDRIPARWELWVVQGLGAVGIRTYRHLGLESEILL